MDILRIVCSTGAHNIWLPVMRGPAILQEPQEVRRSCALASRGGCLSHADHDAPQRRDRASPKRMIFVLDAIEPSPGPAPSGVLPGNLAEHGYAECAAEV